MIAALTITQRVCEDPKIRNCSSLGDAECVRTVGDKLINAGAFDMHEMSVPEQQRWLHDAEPLLKAALTPYDDGKAAGKTCRDTQFHLGSLEARGREHGKLCVRMASDKTPCLAP
ncbi:MAG TPA: hypothetical protein VFN67_41160 [Polyangiales bacterium]|nr:hypothetical protein [Polyangiales bacterium]